jgi:hypothetical protein
MNGTIESIGTIDLSSVGKKVATAAALVSSTEAFSTAGLALQLEMPMVVAANIHGRMVGRSAGTLP